MEQSHNPARDSLALARQHVRALTDGGLSREALLRALLEQEEGSNNLAPLPSQALPTQMQSQPQLVKSSPLSRTMSLSQSTAQSHWSMSTSGHELEEGERPSSSDQLSTSTGHSGSRTSYLSTNTTATSLSSRSSTVTQFPGPELQGSRPTSTSTRAYWCTSCDTEFKRKFDWKRHEDEFHERYKKYPCPDCNRVFWGANTFNQHHKTRHNCKTCPHADKVIKYTRKKRAWACGFCAAFLPSMDRYIDHIGLHYESGRTRAHWFHSNVIYGLLHQPGINPAWRDIIDSKFSHIPKDQQPRYGWDPKTTGRKQGFLENETAGNLQDLLEFFNPTKDDPAKVARMAFDLAELTPVNQAPGRSSLEVPDKSAPPPPPPAPKREKSTASSKRKPSGGIHKNSAPQELPLPPVLKERPLTRWPGLQQPEIPDMPSTKPLPGRDSDVHMSDYDATAVPQPLFAGTLSPTPHPPFQSHTAPTISISRSSDQPSFLAPPTPLPSTPPTPFPGSAMSRDTVVDLLSDYMSPAQLQGLAGSEVQQQQQQQPHVPQGMGSHSPFGTYEDWNSICSTMVEDISSPAHAGPPLPLAPHERPQQAVRRSDFWAPQDDSPEAMYMEGLQRCDLGSLPPPSIHEQSIGRRSDVWASTGAVDYEGMGYDEEIAPPPPSTNWL